MGQWYINVTACQSAYECMVHMAEPELPLAPASVIRLGSNANGRVLGSGAN